MSSGNRQTRPTGGAISRIDLTAPQIGVVKETLDSETTGRLRVWIKGSNTPENDPSGWIICNYASPFAGATDPVTLGNSTGSFEDTQTSYGIWAVPPDTGNEVIIVFINGDIRKAYWVACLYQKDMNHMVPGIADGASFQSSDFGGNALPVAEYNKLSNSTSQRPYYKPLAEGLAKQGLLGDDLRGAGASTSRRESPSKVFGWLTPGGNQFIMDDGENTELIRLRTKSGVQLLLSEVTGDIYAITKDGKSWIELSNDGDVDVYAAGNIDFNAGGDINIRAGQNVNIEAGNNLNELGKNNVNIQAGTNDVNINAAGNNNLYSTKDFNLFSGGDHNVRMNGDFNRTILGDQHLYQDEDKIIIVDIYPHPTTAQYTSPGDLPQPSSAATPVINQQSLRGETSQESPVDTICSRVPDHEPWAGHPNYAVGFRETVEEGTSTASVGSVSTNAARPLTVVGSPTKGMKEGVYTPTGYDKNNKPIYTYNGATTALTPVNDLKTSPAGVEFIASHEGFRPNRYLDVAGKATIGYGHLIIPSDPEKVKTGPLSREECLALLADDLKKAEQAVRKYITVKLTQSQFDALVSFTFNCGGGALQKSTLRKKLNAGDYSEVPNELMKWTKAGGRTVNGLVKRRREEALVFARPAASS